jgi:flagellar biosynthetic protein FliP
MATEMAPSDLGSSLHARHHGHFVRHLLEMAAAMLVGMAAAIPVLGVIFALMDVSADEASERYPELICLVVAAAMIIPMVAWMRHRGHGTRLCAEMALAMVAPLAPIFGLMWAGALPEESACGIYCGIMFPAMAAAMFFRREEYG